MPKTIRIKYTLEPLKISKSQITQENNVIFETLSDELEQCVNSSLKNVVSSEDMYKDIYVKDKNGNIESVADFVDGVMNLKSPSARLRQKLCALYITQSQMKGLEVSCKDKSGTMRTVGQYGTLPTLEDPSLEDGDNTLGLWDLILDYFNFTNERIDAYYARQGTAALPIQTVIVTDPINLVNTHAKHFDKYTEYKTYKDRVTSADAKLFDLYFKDLNFDKVNPKAFNKKTSTKNRTVKDLTSKYNFTFRAIDTIAHCVMLTNGFTLEQIADPTFKPEARAEVGQKILGIVSNMYSEDENVCAAAQKELADIYLEGSKAFLKQKMPTANDLKDFTHAENPMPAFLISRMGQDLAQELNRGPNKTEYIMTNPENRILNDKLAAASNCGNLFTIGKVISASLDDINFAGIENASYAVFEGLRQGMDPITDLTGESIEEFVTKNQGENAFKQFAVAQQTQAYIGTHYSSFSEELADVTPLYSGQLNVGELIAQQEAFKICANDNKTAQEHEGGTYEERYAKLDLAKKIAHIIIPDASHDMKNKMVCAILDNEKIIELLKGKTVEELNELQQPEVSKNIYAKCINALAAPKKETEKEALPIADLSKDKDKATDKATETNTSKGLQ